MAKTERLTVDLAKYPDLVVIYLGMKVNSLRGVGTVMKMGPQISRSVEAKPDGLLLHEGFLFSLFPLHVGMRQYWRDYPSLEAWTRTLPHQKWWKDFLKNPAGTGFWHEAYTACGAMEAVYDNMNIRPGFAAFADVVPARGPMFGARTRLGMSGQAPVGPLPEKEFYSQEK
ncbi:MAG TPA: phenylacetaldoxime dehydratase family protein [Bryobacteraceae bacterium]|nr:phenylacetaldoxime dehydratase family protein [Bryobacteraceae bacterium]